jgi:hypothetical protein
MGQIAKGKKLVSVTIPEAWCSEIDRRAAALHLSRATFTMLILEDWWNRGKPPVSPPDKFMQVANKSKNH